MRGKKQVIQRVKVKVSCEMFSWVKTDDGGSDTAADWWKLPVLCVLQRPGSACRRLRECCRRSTATAWRLRAAVQRERVSPCSRSCWCAACCCSSAMGRAKRSAWERWGADISLLKDFSGVLSWQIRKLVAWMRNYSVSARENTNLFLDWWCFLTRGRLCFSSMRFTAACALRGRCLEWVRASVCRSAVCWRVEGSLPWRRPKRLVSLRYPTLHEEMLCSAVFDLCCLKMKLEGLSGNKTPSGTWLIKASVSAGVPEDRGERCRKRSEGSNAAGQHPRCRTPLVILWSFLF